MAFTKLNLDTCGLLVVDIQERLFGHVERSLEVLQATKTLVQAVKLLEVPIVVTEQVPEKMGSTLLALKEELPQAEYPYYTKSTFSCLGEETIKQEILQKPYTHWILVGMEAHVCILQTAIDLLQAGKEVVIINDAITSRSIYDYSTAIAEMRDWGVRITSSETVLFELLKDSRSDKFKQISQLIK